MSAYFRRPSTPTIGIATLTLAAIGCASGPPQALTTQLAQTDTSIAQAEQAGAARGSLPELQQAKQKRAHAEEAMSDRKYDLSMQLAQQAQVDAQYASIRARAVDAQRAASEAQRGTATLQREAERSINESTRQQP